jgi:hypothetical protein
MRSRRSGTHVLGYLSWAIGPSVSLLNEVLHRVVVNYITLRQEADMICEIWGCYGNDYEDYHISRLYQPNNIRWRVLYFRWLDSFNFPQQCPGFSSRWIRMRFWVQLIWFLSANYHSTIAPSVPITALLRCTTAMARQHIITFSVFKFGTSSPTRNVAGDIV